MNTALLIIDIQREFFSADPEPAQANAVIARINALSRRARAAGAAVIVIQHDESEGEPRLGSVGWTLDERLEVNAGDLRVRKRTPDSFHQTELLRQLTDRAICRVVICGYASEFCVDTTVRRALALGLQVSLAEDGHTTEDKPHMKANDIIGHHNVTLEGITGFAANAIVCPAASFWPVVPSSPGTPSVGSGSCA